MNIKPIAWMYSSRYTGGRWFLTRCQTDLSTYKAEKMVPLYPRTSVDELQRQLAEREAVIVQLREVFEAARQLLRYSGIDKERTRDAADRLDAAIEEVKKLDESDHTALDEAIKAAKVEALEEAGNHYERQMFDHIAAGLRKMADEIRSKI